MPSGACEETLVEVIGIMVWASGFHSPSNLANGSTVIDFNGRQQAH